MFSQEHQLEIIQLPCDNRSLFEEEKTMPSCCTLVISLLSGTECCLQTYQRLLLLPKYIVCRCPGQHSRVPVRQPQELNLSGNIIDRTRWSVFCGAGPLFLCEQFRLLFYYFLDFFLHNLCLIYYRRRRS